MIPQITNHLHRKTPCNGCLQEDIVVSTKEELRIDGKINRIYEERCAWCNNLLYAEASTIVRRGE